MKHTLTKTYKTFLSIFFSLVVFVGLLTAMPDKAMEAKAYLSTTYYCDCDGGYQYVSQSGAVSYSNSYSWISVTKYFDGFFKVDVKPDTNVKSYSTTRTGTVYFKNKSGSIIYSLTVRQTEPYINTYSTYLTVSKDTTSWANLSISYNCKYTIEYPFDLIVKTSYGSTVYSGSTYGSNNAYGISYTDSLRVYPRYANTGSYNKYYTIKLKKAGSNTVVKTINVTHTYY